MELKSKHATSASGIEGRFNRTFMELKSNCKLNTLRGGQSFNRTFMELKYVISQEIYDCCLVLIVPLWN